MADERLTKLLKRLHTKTLDGTISWQTALGDDEFRTILPEAAIIISSEPIKEDPSYPVLPMLKSGRDYHLRILNDQGQIVEDAIARDFKDIDSKDAYRLMAEIYSKARTQALKTSQTVDKILERLG